MAISTVGNFFNRWSYSWRSFLTHFGCSFLEFGMILVLPRTGGGLQGFDLAQAHQFLFCCLGEKALRPRLPTMVSISATSCGDTICACV